MVAVYVYGLALADLAGKEDDSVFEGHGERDLIFLEDIEDTLDYYIM